MGGILPDTLHVWGWVLFGAIVVVLLVIDLLMHHGGHGTSPRSSYLWSAVWIAAGLLFSLLVYRLFGSQLTEEYLAAYLMEKSLSLDNLFVFLVIFRSLSIPQEYQHNVLFWGIIGALAFRAIFIFAGIAAINRFAWLGVVFGLLLIYTAWRAVREDPAQKSSSEIVEFLARFLPVSNDVAEGRWFVRVDGRLKVTSVFIALAAVEVTDILFAIDSVPAVFAVSRDPFVIYSSNIFAILGLRALYTALEHNLRDFPYLHYGLAGVLAFAGIKLVFEEWLHIHPLLSVAIIISIISSSITASVIHKRRNSSSA